MKRYKAWLKEEKKIVEIEALDWKFEVIMYEENTRVLGHQVMREEFGDIELLEPIGLIEQGPDGIEEKEIYLGDILVVDTEDGINLCEVVRKAVIGGYQFKIIKELDIDCSSDNEEEWEGEDLEKYREYIGNFHFIRIVGNKFENQELLNKEV